MWSNLPLDILCNIFSFLSPESLACADSTCRNWHVCARSYPLLPRPQPPWFVAMPSRSRDPACCYLHNPNTNTWHFIRLDHVIHQPVRPVASIGTLLLLKPAASSPIPYLSICNPFTKQVKHLPKFNRPRTNPALGIVTTDSSFRIYLAGGMLEGPRGSGALYETTLEMYDSGDDKWRVVGSMPMELAVRLTVWTPNESVYSEGVVYWMTSARAYTVMGFDIGRDRWHELSVPLADRLEFAALVQLPAGDGKLKKLVMVGGVCGEEACVWELLGENWGVILSKVPAELGRRLVGDKLSWGNTKCVGIEDGSICLYRDLGSGMVVWRHMEREWEWVWVEGCTAIKGSGQYRVQLHNYAAVRGLLLQPGQSSSFLLSQPLIKPG